MSEPAVIGERTGRIGRLVLNRPKTLNALDLGMIRGMRSILDSWSGDPSVHAVVVESATDKAFCAGGDVRALREHALAGDAGPIESFFSEEYSLNAVIAEYPKPYISLIDGICMGGGIGISVHGRIAVTTDAGVFAMPETGIGLFPDVGGSFALPRMPGALGIYLGLTGLRVTGADAVHSGLATHLVAKSDLDALRNALVRDGAAAIAPFARPLPPFTLADRRKAIDRCFTAASVPEIIDALKAEGTAFALETLEVLQSVSPSALFWTFEIMRRGTELPLREALSMELVLARRAAMHPDFGEGVRAALVDKDRSPEWNPPRIDDVDPDEILRMFYDGKTG